MGSTQSRKALDRARAFHQKGSLAEAERLYRAELRRDAGSVDALHLLGLLNAQRGELEAARALFDRALGLDPGRAELHFLRAEVAGGLGLAEQALDGYRQALAVRPDYADALINLGGLLLQLERAAEALPLLERALLIRPGDTAALNNRGNALQALKRHDEARACFDRVLALLPDNADVFNNRASALLSLGSFAQAEADCRRALAQRPQHPQALLNLGRAQAAQGMLSEGVASFDAALSINPSEFDGWYERGVLLTGLQRYDAARDSLDKALRLKPDSAGAWNDLGTTLLHLGRYQDAVNAYDRSLSLRRDNGGTWANRGLALQFLERREEAADAYANALRLDAQCPYAEGRQALLRFDLCNWRDESVSIERIMRGVRAGGRAAEPFDFLFFSDRADAQLQCARTYSHDKYPRHPEPLWQGGPYRHERIRVAYVSADFRDHPTSYLLAGLLEMHDRSRFEIFGVSLGPDQPGPMATRIEAACEHFLRVRDLNDRDIAALLRRHEIDIAVDLMGCTGLCRTTVYAMRPCPVQVNYLGYPGTMGADYFDYIVADRYVVPDEKAHAYAEKVVRLPDTFQANDARRAMAPPAPARESLGLPRTATAFCSFNKGTKITPAMFSAWMDVLNTVRESVLWLPGGSATIQGNLRREAQARGIDGSRLVFAPWAPYAEHLARLQHAEVALDTLPFNGGATTSDALWAGVPVVTMSGDALAARMSGSLLHAIGMPELITSSLEAYKALAVRLATDPELLVRTKRKLAANRHTHPLFDTDRFRRHIEAAYEIMWRRYQAGEPPAAFSVDAIADTPATHD